MNKQDVANCLLDMRNLENLQRQRAEHLYGAIGGDTERFRAITLEFLHGPHDLPPDAAVDQLIQLRDSTPEPPEPTTPEREEAKASLRALFATKKQEGG